MPSQWEHGTTHLQLAKTCEFGLVEKISADDAPSTDSSLEAVALSASVHEASQSGSSLPRSAPGATQT